MDTTQKAVLIAHTLIALGIITLVLLQRGKGADAGAAFGAGASGTVFGARGSSSFFSRATAVLATAFFISSLTLAYMSSQRTIAPTSLIEEVEAVEAPVNNTLPANDEMPLSDMPSLEPTDDAVNLPAVEPSLEQVELPTLDEDEQSGDQEP